MNRLFCISLLSLLSFIPIFGQKKVQRIKINVFNETPILFNPSDYPDGASEKNGTLYLGNGRIALKKIQIPRFKRNTKANIKITLVSNGDPWDKSGSCFVIPRD